MSDKTILYINNFAGPGLGGGERHLGLLAAAVRRAGWRVVIACLPGSDVGAWLGEQGHHVVEFNPGDPNLPQTIAQLRQIIMRERVKIVHAHGFWPGNVARAAVRLPTRLNPQPAVVTTIHCQPNSIARPGAGAIARAKFGLRRGLDRVTGRWGDIFIAVSKEIEDQLKAQGIPAERVVQIYNGVDVDGLRLRAGQDSRGKTGQRQIGTVARLEPVKGLNDLIKAFSLIAPEFADVRLVMIGGGPLESELKSRARQLNLVDRIEFTGYLENPLPRLRGFEVYVLPSWSEGLNITLLEAMALERHVIATDVGGNKEVVQDGISGDLVAAHDPTSLARALSRALTEPMQSRNLGLAGAELVRKKFSAQAMNRQVLDVYDRLS